ncbi:MAG: N-acetylmuramic acid 6-phosphate etherase [Caldilineaceae bacterium]|nr:N-acetylmuramic acid 6-phosphate etherase [Caldilineaceae bacterium]
MHTNLPQTEQRNPASAAIDTLPTLEICRLINRQDAQVPLAVAEALPQIAQAVDLVAAALQSGHRIFYQGAGTSGRLGVLDASELLPTYSFDPTRAIGLIAGGRAALTDSVEAAEDDPDLGRGDLQAHHFAAGDILVGIAASGRTPYVLGGMDYARSLGAPVVAVVCAANSPMAARATVAIELLTGPEVITGSTRMKAGTSQKMALNMLSTAAMVKLGKVYGNLMVDVRPTNAKLRARAARIIAEAAGISLDQAEAALAASGWEVKVAVVMGLLDVPAAAARRLLDQHQGRVRAAVQAGSKE